MIVRPLSYLLIIFLFVVPQLATAQSPSGFNSSSNGQVQALTVQPDGQILVGGSFTMLGGGGASQVSRSKLARIRVDGSVDPAFNPGADFSARTFLPRPDGSLVVGGLFGVLGGGPRVGIGKLSAGGTLDSTFIADVNGDVNVIIAQPDGKLLVGGAFADYSRNGVETARNGILRLHPDGTLDASFNPGTNFLGIVNTLALQPDGKILVGGSFSGLGGGTGVTPRRRIGRINSDGTVDATFDPGANNTVSAIALQPDGDILVAGAFALIGGGGTGNVGQSYLARLKTSGAVDTSYAPNPDNSISGIALQPDGKAVVIGNFQSFFGSGGSVSRPVVARVNLSGTLDTSFNPPDYNGGFFAVAIHPDGSIFLSDSAVLRLHPDGSPDVVTSANVNSNVTAIAVQPDSKVVLAGNFTTIGLTTRHRLARISPAGSLDLTFDPGANGVVYGVLIQRNGQMVVAGSFTMIGGGGTGQTARSRLARLNQDGTVDTSFNPGVDGTVYAAALQADGKILVGGSFSRLGGGGTGQTPRFNLGRLNLDGSLDTSFNPGANGTVYSLAVQADGKVLVGGGFTMLGDGGTGQQPRQRIGRLNADGTPDASFNPGANSFVTTITQQADGKILIGGSFTLAGGGGSGNLSRLYIARLNDDGAVDSAFNPGADNAVFTLAVQADGRILVGGSFALLGCSGGGCGSITNNLGRLLSDGSLDVSFNPGANDAVLCFGQPADGMVFVGGLFTMIGGGGFGAFSRERFAQLSTSDPSLQSLLVTATGVVTWLRSGSGPEVSRVTVDFSSDGASYFTLGEAARISGGWRYNTIFASPASFFIRARGYVAGGDYSASSSIVESIRYVHLGSASSGFTDDPLTSYVTSVKAVHVAELRTRIDGLRTRYGLLAFAYSDASLIVGATSILTQHITQLRTALAEVYSAAGQAAPAFTDATLTARSTSIRAIHMTELRDAILAIE